MIRRLLRLHNRNDLKCVRYACNARAGRYRSELCRRCRRCELCGDRATMRAQGVWFCSSIACRAEWSPETAKTPPLPVGKSGVSPSGVADVSGSVNAP